MAGRIAKTMMSTTGSVTGHKSHNRHRGLRPITAIVVAGLISLPGLSPAGIAQTPVAEAPVTRTRIADQPSGTYTLDPKHASLVWKVFHLGLSRYTARFNRIEASLVWDGEDVTQAKVSALIDPASVDTGFPDAATRDFDKELANEEKYFNAKKYPFIRFRSLYVEKTGERTGRMAGALQFRGITKPVMLEVTFNGGTRNILTQKPNLGFSAHGTIKRSEWGMDALLPYVADEVEILIEAEFEKQ